MIQEKNLEKKKMKKKLPYINIKEGRLPCPCPSYTPLLHGNGNTVLDILGVEGGALGHS